jgi:hypothetical protein
MAKVRSSGAIWRARRLFAAGTVLVPGLVEGKLAGAAGELGDASQLLKAGTTLVTG